MLGDITQQEVLKTLGCKDARLVVISINDARATELAVGAIRKLAPDLPIVVRAWYDMDQNSLHAAGATTVVSAENTTSAAIVRSIIAALHSTKTETQNNIHEETRDLKRSSDSFLYKKHPPIKTPLKHFLLSLPT